MSGNGIDLFVQDLHGPERVLIVRPAGIRRSEVFETQIVLSVLEWHLENARLLCCAEVADATVGISDLNSYRATGTATAASAGHCEGQRASVCYRSRNRG